MKVFSVRIKIKSTAMGFPQLPESRYVLAESFNEVADAFPDADMIAFIGDAEALKPKKPVEPVTVTVTTSPVPDGDTYTGTSKAFQDRLDDVRLPKEG